MYGRLFDAESNSVKSFFRKKSKLNFHQKMAMRVQLLQLLNEFFRLWAGFDRKTRTRLSRFA